MLEEYFLSAVHVFLLSLWQLPSIFKVSRQTKISAGGKYEHNTNKSQKSVSVLVIEEINWHGVKYRPRNNICTAFLLSYMFCSVYYVLLCCPMYYLFVNVYFITATGCQSNCS